MPIGDPRDDFFYPTLTLMIDSYIIVKQFLEAFVMFSHIKFCT